MDASQNAMNAGSKLIVGAVKLLIAVLPFRLWRLARLLPLGSFIGDNGTKL
jgi:hypothetical protein